MRVLPGKSFELLSTGCVREPLNQDNNKAQLPSHLKRFASGDQFGGNPGRTIPQTPIEPAIGNLALPEFPQGESIASRVENIDDHQLPPGLQNTRGLGQGFLATNRRRNIVKSQAGEQKVKTVLSKG